MAIHVVFTLLELVYCVTVVLRGFMERHQRILTSIGKSTVLDLVYIRSPRITSPPMTVIIWGELATTQIVEMARVLRAQKLEDSGKPVIAAIHGSCLGEGLEVMS